VSIRIASSEAYHRAGEYPTNVHADPKSDIDTTRVVSTCSCGTGRMPWEDAIRDGQESWTWRPTRGGMGLTSMSSWTLGAETISHCDLKSPQSAH